MKPGERLVSLRDSGADLHALVPLRKTRPPGAAGVQDAPLLSIRNLRKSFTIKSGGFLKSRRDKRRGGRRRVSFDIRRGECLGLVGESGCGKTSLSKLMMRAMTPDRGSVVFNDGTKEIDVLKLKGEALRAFRPRVQMIFQDPVSSLSPRMTVMNIIREPLEIHGVGTSKEQTERVGALMAAVGLDRRFLNRYPHSFSGGQRQRISIARTLAMNPDLIICDEPVSALDVSVQAQVLNLLKDLKRELGAHLPVHLPQPRRGGLHRRSHRRPGARAHRRDRAASPPVLEARAFLHAGADARRALSRPRPAARPAADRGRQRVGPRQLGSGVPRRRRDPASVQPIDLGDGHVVLARPSVGRRELLAS